MGLKILWCSNSPWSPTGYGIQTATFIWRLQALGHEVTCQCFYGLQGASLLIDGIRMLPAAYEAYGQDVIVADAVDNHADAVITLIDVWVYPPALMEKIAWYPWTPLDHDPMPPAVEEALRAARRPIAMARFGEAQMRAHGFDPLYVPHGVSTHDYYPVPREEARRTLHCDPDDFLVGIVAANKGAPSRKALDQQIRAFGYFLQRHPRARLYLHTDWTGRIGEPIIPLLHHARIPADRVLRPSAYQYDRGQLGADYMRAAYSALDVLLNATRGEGFGVPIIEAQACGTPVIVTDFSAMPELVRAGWAVGVSDLFYSQESYQATPAVDDIVEALEQAYQKRGDLEFRAQACEGIVADYDADVVTARYWSPALAAIEADVRAVPA